MEEECGSHFSQAFISEHHGPADDEGISRSQSVGKLQAKDEGIEKLRNNLYLGSQKLIDVINVQDQACKKQQPDRQLAYARALGIETRNHPRFSLPTRPRAKL